MHEVHDRLDETMLAIRGVEGDPDPAVQRLAASAAALAATLQRLARERVWS